MAWRGGALVVVAAAVLASAAGATNPPGPPAVPVGSIGSMTPGSGVAVAVSSAQAGAQPVALTLSFDAALVCGRVRGVTTVTLPAAATVPATVAPGAVTINGKPAGKVVVHGSAVSITPPAVTGMSCHSVVLGTMRIAFTRAAGLGNPAAGGSYAVTVRRGGQQLHGTLTIVG